MNKITYKDKTEDNKVIQYEILNNGFRIYVGSRKYPAIEQLKPFIPDPNKSYEENAIEMCESLTGKPNADKQTIDERISNIEANVDYLLLLNDPDSATEESV